MADAGPAPQFNSGINFVLRSGGARRRWKERVGIAPRSSYSFSIPPQDHGGAQTLSDITGGGINRVANAAAQSADHVTSYFAMLRAELGFYVSCLNLRDQLLARGQPISGCRPRTTVPGTTHSSR